MSGYRHSGMCTACHSDREQLLAARDILNQRSERPLRSMVEYLEDMARMIENRCQFAETGEMVDCRQETTA